MIITLTTGRGLISMLTGFCSFHSTRLLLASENSVVEFSKCTSSYYWKKDSPWVGLVSLMVVGLSSLAIGAAVDSSPPS